MLQSITLHELQHWFCTEHIEDNGEYEVRSLLQDTAFSSFCLFTYRLCSPVCLSHCGSRGMRSAVVAEESKPGVLVGEQTQTQPSGVRFKTSQDEHNTQVSEGIGGKGWKGMDNDRPSRGEEGMYRYLLSFFFSSGSWQWCVYVLSWKHEGEVGETFLINTEGDCLLSYVVQ